MDATLQTEAPDIVSQSEDTRMYTLFNLFRGVDEMRSNAKGTIYPEIGKGRFCEMAIIRPSDSILRAFSTMVNTPLEQIRCLKQHIASFQTGRDLFLPRLIGGDTVV
jgi:hypothetical protein